MLIIVVAISSCLYSAKNYAHEVMTVTGEDLPVGAEWVSTATKVATGEMDTPQSVSAISRDLMERQSAQTLSQALRYSNVQSEDRGRATAAEFFSNRGFALDRYLDGLRLPQIGVYGAPQIDPWLLEQATVLSGPASVLYGQTPPGGIVNMQSKLPGRGIPQQVVLRGGSDRRAQASFDVGGEMTNDGSLLWRLAGNGYKTDTQVRYTQEQRYAIAPALTWHLSDATTLTLLANWQHDPDNYHDIVPAEGSALPGPNGRIPRDFFAGEPDFNRYDRKQWGGGWRLEHHVNGDLTFRQNARYMHSDFSMDAVMAGGLAANYRTLYRYSFSNHTRGEGATIDNQLEWRTQGGSLDQQLLAGFDVQWTKAEISQGAGRAAPISDIFNPVYGAAVKKPDWSSRNEQTNRQYGLYFQDAVNWGELSLLAGLRHDWLDGNTENLIAGKEQKQRDRQLSWRTGGVWHMTPTLAPWLGYATSFQPTAGVDFYNNAFKPRTAEQYEAGLRWQPVADLLLSVAVFEINQKNVLTDDPYHRRYKIQSGEVRSRGVEAQAQGSPFSGLTVSANWRYGDAEVREDSNKSLVGKAPAGFARHSGSLWSDYQFQSGIADGFGVGMGVRYTGKSQGDTRNSFTAPSYTLLDAALYYRFSDVSLKGVQLSLNANNLLDKQYTASCGGDGRSSWCFPGLERSVVASVAYQW